MVSLTRSSVSQSQVSFFTYLKEIRFNSCFNFHIFFSPEFSYTGDTDSSGFNRRYTNGITIGPRNSLLNTEGTSFILIAHDFVEPLFNPNLLPEDRALNNFQIVSVVLHELTVRDSSPFKLKQ